MSAYIAIVELADDHAYAEQRKRLVERVEKLGGRYLVAGAPSRVVEGGLGIGRVVLIECDSVEAAEECFATEEYAELRECRAKAGAFACAAIAQGV